MDKGPNHSVRALAVAAWGALTVEERAGGQLMRTACPWPCGTTWSNADFHRCRWVLPLIMLSISECPDCSSSLDYDQ